MATGAVGSRAEDSEVDRPQFRLDTFDRRPARGGIRHVERNGQIAGPSACELFGGAGGSRDLHAAAASCSAMSRPMPVDAPVIQTIFQGRGFDTSSDADEGLHDAARPET